MNFSRYLLPVCVAALPLMGGTIDVSKEAIETLNTGDVLSFLLSDNSFATHAAGLGLSPAPTYLMFDFISGAGITEGQFSALLASSDGAVTAPFTNPLSWGTGVSSTFGGVSQVSGSLNLSESISQQIFADSTANLILTYSGPAEQVGIAPNTLRQDLSVSLNEGPLNVSSQMYSVGLSQTAAPEPGVGLLLLGGGGLLCALSKLLRRISHGRAE